LASEWISKGIATGNLNEQIETLGDIADITGTIQTDLNSQKAENANLKKMIDGTITVTSEGQGPTIIEYDNLKVGSRFLIQNVSETALCNVFTRQTATGTNVEKMVENFAAGNSRIYEVTVEASVIYVYLNNAGTVIIKDLSKVSPKLDEVAEKTQKFEGIATLVKRTADIDDSRYNTTIYGTKFSVKNGHTYLITNKNAEGAAIMRFGTNATTYISGYQVTVNGGQSVEFTATQDTSYIAGFSNNAAGTHLTIEDLSTSIKGRVEKIEANTVFSGIPLVKFNFDHTLRDVSTDVAVIDWTKADSYQEAPDCLVMEQVYTLFDELVTNNPTYVTRVDAAVEAGLTYPAYANGISTAGTYLVTPAYKVWMYKFIDTNTFVNTAISKKKKLFIIGGTHGNENAAPFNLYLFAKQLCSGFLTDDNFLKLRQAYNIYIIPCLNGYGMYHVTRGNANKIDINRNYPTAGWVVANADTQESPTNNRYTGAVAGSEFEVQLVMAITNLIKPDIAIDHHNYSVADWQFYTTIGDTKKTPLVYQSLVDCTYTFKKEKSTYFGTSSGLLINKTGSAPGEISSHVGMAPGWWDANGVKFSATVEISQNINYQSGVFANTKVDNYGNDAFSIGEYTLRNQILRYCQWVLERS